MKNVIAEYNNRIGPSTDNRTTTHFFAPVADRTVILLNYVMENSIWLELLAQSI
jgi:hypothetical protein